MALHLLHLLAFSLLFAVATPIRDITDVCSSQIKDFQYLNSTGLHLELHHPRSPCSPAPVPADLPFTAVLTHDDARISSLAARLAKTPSARATSLDADADAGLAGSLASVPLSPGASVGVGNYVTRMGLGTPATQYVMVVDTGSSLTWLQCSPCLVSCHRQSGPVFNPKSSSTYASVGCSAQQCSDLPSATLNPSGLLLLQRLHLPGQLRRQLLLRRLPQQGHRLVRLDVAAKLLLRLWPGQPRVVSPIRPGSSASSRNKLSLLYQLAPSLGYSFTYCLPSSSSSGYLSLGSYNPGQYSLHARWCPARSTTRSTSSSSCRRSSTPARVITRLPTSVYSALSKAVAAAMKGTSRASAYSILDTCFKGQASRVSAPAVTMSFAGGAALKLSAQNLLVDVDDSTTCLAFAPARSAAIIGNTQQQTFSVVYDVKSSRIGFAAGGCS
ncbi:hypothetical protein OsJ_08178 [Oryza sativa Japonica Group]|uniref:Peptidase A1 domain-containing protein n=1 Tax=Oryza sativa subsp. japonica TaxID=39947 RepID=B9F2E7_ORYSJ|nr:hypothetical protein OsJ_08178 [Oryza sativa Japonica Group]